MRASHIAGVENTLADALSRGRVSQGEWELDPQWANFLFERLGRPPFCDGAECQAADVLLEGFRPPGMGSRCDVLQLGQSRQLRISAAQHDTQGASQNQGLQDENPPD